MENIDKTKEQLLQEIEALQKRLDDFENKGAPETFSTNTQPKDTNLHTETNRNLKLKQQTDDYDGMMKELLKKDITLKMKSEVNVSIKRDRQIESCAEILSVYDKLLKRFEKVRGERDQFVKENIDLTKQLEESIAQKLKIQKENKTLYKKVNVLKKKSTSARCINEEEEIHKLKSVIKILKLKFENITKLLEKK